MEYNLTRRQIVACGPIRELRGIARRSIARKERMYDEVMRGGTVIDGTGARGVIADVAIKDGRIAAIGTIVVNCE